MEGLRLCKACILLVILYMFSLQSTQGVSSVGLKIVVEFAYTGSLNVNLDNLEDVLAAVSHLQVSHQMYNY